MDAGKEICLRCGAEMDWRQSTWQCPSCRFKLGCCEGEAGDGRRLCPPASGGAGVAGAGAATARSR